MSYWVQKFVAGVAAKFAEFATLDMAMHAMMESCTVSRGDQFRVIAENLTTPWFTAKSEAEDPTRIAIVQNELITYAQCGTARLQQLVDLFGDMVQDKAGDPATRIQRIDALADIIRNQLQELQTIATPTK